MSFEIIKDLADICLEKGITKIKYNGIELEMALNKKIVDDKPIEAKQELMPTEDQLLFWSVEDEIKPDNEVR